MEDFRMEVQRCVRCTLPVTWETLYFDNEGVCNICRNWEVKQDVVDWVDREKQLKDIVDDIKEQNNEYDCIVPFSGGKDSTFTLWAVVKKYGLKPLVVSFDHWFYRPRTIDNRKKTFSRLGVDVITFTPNWQIVRKLMVESLIRRGDFCWHCHAGVYTYAMQIAVRFKIPFLVWGEGGGEYEGYFKLLDLEETDEWKFNRRVVLGMRAEDMAGFINVDLKDLAPYMYPTKEELDTIGAISLSLGNYVPWDQEKQTEIIKKELGWQEDEVESLYPNTLSFDKVECMFTGIRDYIKLLKRGFSRITHRTTIDIKQGKITRDEAIKLIDKYEKRKPRSLSVFLEYIDMPEDEFNDICLKHVVPPAKPVDPKTIPDGDKLWDQDLWFRDAEK